MNYMLINRKVEGGLEHTGANCFEALLGAVYLDSGDMSVVDSLFARLAFPDQVIHPVVVKLCICVCKTALYYECQLWCGYEGILVCYLKLSTYCHTYLYMNA